MSLLRRIEITIGLLLLITVAVLATQVWVARKRADVVKQQVHAVTADLGAAEVHAEEQRIIYKDREIKNERVRKAVAANQEWADSSLPDDITEQLQHSSGATRGVPESLPSDLPAERR